jgi:hypothetical protein
MYAEQVPIFLGMILSFATSLYLVSFILWVIVPIGLFLSIFSREGLQ